MHRLTALAITLLSTSGLVASAPIEPPQPSPVAILLADQTNRSEALQPYKSKDYSGLLGMSGFSDNALNLHFKLYQGYVKNTNQLVSILNQILL